MIDGTTSSTIRVLLVLGQSHCFKTGSKRGSWAASLIWWHNSKKDQQRNTSNETNRTKWSTLSCGCNCVCVCVFVCLGSILKSRAFWAAEIPSVGWNRLGSSSQIGWTITIYTQCVYIFLNHKYTHTHTYVSLCTYIYLKAPFLLPSDRPISWSIRYLQLNVAIKCALTPWTPM